MKTEISETRGGKAKPKSGRKVHRFSGEIHDDGSATSSIHYKQPPSKPNRPMPYEEPETAGHSTVDEMLDHLRTKVGTPDAPTAAAGRPKTVAKQTQPAPEPPSAMA